VSGDFLFGDGINETVAFTGLGSNISVGGSFTANTDIVTTGFNGTTFTFNHNSSTPGATIQSNGVIFGNINFNNAGGLWTLQDALTVANNRTLFTLAGTVDTNNQNVNAGFIGLQGGNFNVQ